VRLPAIIFEVIYNVEKYTGFPGEYVFANGDITGYKYHADFMNGWDPAFLKQALEECKNDHGDVERLPCNLLTKQEMGDCPAENYMPLAALANERCSGVIDRLCNSENFGKPMAMNSAAPAQASTLVEPSRPLEPADLVESAKAEESTPPQTSQAPDNSGSWHPPMAPLVAPALVSDAPKLDYVATVYEHVTVTHDVWHTVYADVRRPEHHRR
jgi:hypothetical protein